MEVKQNTAEEENMPEWVRPNLVNEKGELERTMRDFLGEEVTSGNLNRFMNILNNSPIIGICPRMAEPLTCLATSLLMRPERAIV